jgi:FkbM family methyltransferase
LNISLAPLATLMGKDGDEGRMSVARSVASAAYGQALRVVYSRKGFPWRVHDEIVRIDPAVRHLVPHDPEPPLFEFLRRTIRPGDVVLDVGAFLGIYAVLESRWAGPDGRVIAFEPTPASAEVARRHIAWNGPEGTRVHLVEAAAYDRPGRATLHQYDAVAMPYVNSLAAAVDVDADAPATEQPVALTTIDEVCGQLGVSPSVIRMDVQGAEIHALRGARETIRACRRLSIVVEMHPQCWPAFGVTDEAARQTIRELGLDVRPLVPSESVFARDAHAILSIEPRTANA